MALPASFSTNTNPTGGQLDQNFAAVAFMGSTLATAGGTANAIVLTPAADQPTVASYTNGALFRFVATDNSTGSVTLGVNALSALPLYKPDGVQAGNGDMLNGSPYVVMYLSALNSGAGGFIMLSALPAAATTPSTVGAAQGLVVTNNAVTPNTQIDIDALAAVLVTTGGLPFYSSAPNVTIDLTTTGANGMDTGARPSNNWVYCYLISNGAVTAGLASATSPASGAPTMPSGYSYQTFVGAMFLDGSQNLRRSIQKGARGQYKVTSGTNTAVVPNIAASAAGTFSTTSPTLSAVSITPAVVPVTASAIQVLAATAANAAGPARVLVAPSTDYGGSNRGPEGSAGQSYPIYLDGNEASNSASAEINLEGTTIAWASDASGGAIACLGWTDFYVNA